MGPSVSHPLGNVKLIFRYQEVITGCGCPKCGRAR